MDVTLRKVTENDSLDIIGWRNENAQYFPPVDHELCLHDHVAWFRRTYLLDPADHYYMVCADQRSVGTIAYNSATGELGRVLLGEKRFARQGVMSAAIGEIEETFAPEWMWLYVLPDNKVAIRFYEKYGFLRSGALQPGGGLKMEIWL